MFKSYAANVVFGLVSGLIGAYVALHVAGPDVLLSSSEFNAELKSQIASTLPSATPTPSPSPADAWQRITRESAMSSVAVQVFQNNKLTSEVSGIILSTDGLVVVPHDTVARATVVQILRDDTITRADIVAHNAAANIALLKIASSGLSVANLSSNAITSGQEVLLVGAITDAAKSIVVAQRGMISYVSSKSIAIDTEPTVTLSGAKIHDAKGAIIGMAYIRSGKVFTVSSETIKQILNDYLKNLPQ